MILLLLKIAELYVFDVLQAIHAECCSSQIKRDKTYVLKLSKERSFRGVNPICETWAGGSGNQMDTKVKEIGMKEDKATSAEHSTSDALWNIDEDDSGLPSYKEATS